MELMHTQIDREKMNQLWGNQRSNRIWILNHSLNEDKCIERMIRSTKALNPYKIIVGIDSRTNDLTEGLALSLGTETFQFDWCHNFSYPKNLLTHKVPKGDWCLVMGGDFELQKHTVQEILEFIDGDCNVAAKFQIPEYAPDDRPVVTRPRALLWRSHPLLYWERLVHEEMLFSLYRLLAIGIPFTPDKDIPLLGGTNGIVHYADHEDTPEEKWRKRCYYLVLYEIDRKLRRSNRPEEDIKNYDVDKLVSGYMHGLPEGLEELYERSKIIHTSIEYD